AWETKALSDPSGDHLTLPRSPSATRRSELPSGWTTLRCVPTSSWETKAMSDPPGDHCTSVSVSPGAPAPVGSGTGWGARRPVASAITSLWAPSAREGPHRLAHAGYASFVPSGDHENSRTCAAIRVRTRPSLDATKSTWS